MKHFETQESDILNTRLSPKDDCPEWRSYGELRRIAGELWDGLQQYLFYDDPEDAEPLRLLAVYGGWATMICDNGSIIHGWAAMFKYHHVID
jgi:hypothetical protein